MPAVQKKSLKEYLWNRDEGTVLGRTGLSWFKITVFYIIFYACLAAFWTACLVIFLQTISDKEPRWTTTTDSIIGKNPGLGYRPRPPSDRIESTLVMFNRGKGENWGHWVSELTNVTKEYNDANNKIPANPNSQKCTGAKTETLETDQFCQFDIAKLGTACSAPNKFGYEVGHPCIMIKLNKIFDWKPETYDTVKDLPALMPQDVKDIIKNDFSSGSDNQINSQNVWITCEGENSNDKENIGKVNYFPHPGMPTYYYPFKNQLGYQAPLVAVEFANVKAGVLLNIECKAWAKNIHHDRKERRGSVHLELMID